MSEPTESPMHPESLEPSGAGADPLAMIAFLQRLVATMSSGGDVEALMTDAPPGFRELFADAERRVQAGETPDLGALMGLFGAGSDDDADGDDADGADADEGGPGEAERDSG
jgi:hypothetical protein